MSASSTAELVAAAAGPATGRLARLAQAALPVLGILVPVTFVGATLAVAGDTLGYDFLAYHAAASRVLVGQPLYDTSFDAAGGFGLFYYPPFFAPLVLPFGLLDPTVATWLWISLLGVAFCVGTAILPVSRAVRWAILILAGVSWPFVYAMKLGQVGPLLYLLFAIGWRSIDRPAPFGIVAGLGAAIKLQPGLTLVWAILSGRWRSAAWGAATLVVLAALATTVAGIGQWPDFLVLIGRVADPITTEHNFTPGAVAFQLGVPRDWASALQFGVMIGALALVVVVARRGAADAGYLVTVVTSQLVSPILWDHYAVVLLLPVAWLLADRQWWAALVPLVVTVPLVGVTPPATYASLFAIVGAAVAARGLRTGHRETSNFRMES